MPQYLHNCCLALDNRLIADGSLRIVDGLIDRIGGSALPGDEAIDGRGALLAPGLIDLHCDALEKIIETRPGVRMPQGYVMPVAEGVYAAAGITTIFHAVSFADNELGLRSVDVAADIAADIVDWQQHQVIDHRLHARYEISDPAGLTVVQELVDRQQVDLISLMDHSPGQGQFRDLQSFIAFYTKTYGADVAAATALAESKQAGIASGWDRARQVAAHARTAGVPLASHDDDSPEKIALIKELGVAIAEFPVNLATVAAAHDAGLTTILGAPNVVRGGSQSGNMRALDAIHAGSLDGLCADYVPWTMLAAACRVPELSEWSLPDAMRLVSRNPARAVGLTDRGRLADGLRADLILVGLVRGLPQVITTWAGGRLAHRSEPPQLQPWPLQASQDLAASGRSMQA